MTPRLSIGGNIITMPISQIDPFAEEEALLPGDTSDWDGIHSEISDTDQEHDSVKQKYDEYNDSLQPLLGTNALSQKTVWSQSLRNIGMWI